VDSSGDVISSSSSLSILDTQGIVFVGQIIELSFHPYSFWSFGNT
jgi:hypothetical protein